MGHIVYQLVDMMGHIVHQLDKMMGYIVYQLVEIQFSFSSLHS